MSEIAIRAAQESDAVRILEIYAPYVRETAISFEWKVPTLREFKARIKRIFKKYPYIVAEKDGVVVGYAYADSFKGRAAYDWSVETSIYVEKSARGCGIGRVLYESLEKILKKMGILNLNACIAFKRTEDEHLTNASPRFHERLGFHFVGTFHNCGFKFGKWYDMIWMEKLLDESDLPSKNATRTKKPEKVRGFSSEMVCDYTR